MKKNRGLESEHVLWECPEFDDCTSGVGAGKIDEIKRLASLLKLHGLLPKRYVDKTLGRAVNTGWERVHVNKT